MFVYHDHKLWTWYSSYWNHNNIFNILFILSFLLFFYNRYMDIVYQDTYCISTSSIIFLSIFHDLMRKQKTLFILKFNIWFTVNIIKIIYYYYNIFWRFLINPAFTPVIPPYQYHILWKNIWSSSKKIPDQHFGWPWS